jgi:hypothetical protein
VESLGQDIRIIIAGDSLGHVVKPIPDIMLQLTTMYGRTTVQRLKELKDALHTPLTVHSFLTGTAKMTNAFSRYLVLGEIIGPLRQFELLKEACEGDPGLKSVLNLYTTLYPDCAVQRFPTAVAFITERLPTITVAAIYPSAHAATTLPTPSTELTSIVASLRSEIATLRAQINPRPTANLFCFGHGPHSAHLGKHCNVMLAEGSGFSTLHLNATASSPTSIEGKNVGCLRQKPRGPRKN